jgi:hypothetical protein
MARYIIVYPECASRKPAGTGDVYLSLRAEVATRGCRKVAIR